jgi:hypothetical protein
MKTVRCEVGESAKAMSDILTADQMGKFRKLLGPGQLRHPGGFRHTGMRTTRPHFSRDDHALSRRSPDGSPAGIRAGLL